jgi:hypothetical protein
LDDSAENVENPGVGPRWGGLETRSGSDHPRAVENMGALSTRRDMFLDERGAGLRVTWHPERDLVVLSVWQGDSCVGTFRMPVQDVPRLSGLLAAALGDWAGEAGVGAEAGMGPADSVAQAAGVAGRETRTAGRETGNPGQAGGSAGRGGLSVQRRIRLSRPVLRLRGLRHRRRGSA